MPQLVPFYFINEVVFTFISLTILVYLFSKYILPKLLLNISSRIYITKL